MTEYAYSRKEPCISVATSTSTMFSSTGMGSGEPDGRRAIGTQISSGGAVGAPLSLAASEAGPTDAPGVDRCAPAGGSPGGVPDDDDARPATRGGDYPLHWEADVVLRDGGTAHVRPIRPDDADALQAFHLGQSQRSTYFRFFAPLQRLPEIELARFTQVDHRGRVALVAITDSGDTEQIIAVARYDRTAATTAEVAFNVADSHHGRGLGSVLLEHLAAAARERGIHRFTAEVLPQNGRMLAVFREAGYVVQQRLDDGIVWVSFGVDPTARSLAVMADREHRAEARSVNALLTSRSVLVVTDPEAPDHLAACAVLRHLVAADDVEVDVVGWQTPPEPSATRCRSTAQAARWSGASGSVTTRTDREVSSALTLLASARCSRSAITARDRAVGSTPNDTHTIPSSSRCWTTYPASRNTASIRPFCGSTSAVNRWIPRSRAAAARCSSSTEPNPRPWWLSATLNATSAVVAAVRSYRATAMICSVSPESVMATSATRPRWSTWVNRASSISRRRCSGAKNRKYVERWDWPRWNACSASASSGRIGRTWAVPPSRRTTSASQCRG